MALLLDIIKTKLTTDGVLDGSSWIGHIGYSPDEQDQVISLYHTGGFPQETLGGENVQETFQVRVRAGRYEHDLALNKWQDMFNSLQDADLSSDNVYLIQALATGPLHYMDDKQRHNFTANFRVIRAKP